MLRDRHVLSFVTLGLDAPAFGWPAGVGLRWSLPAATTIHEPSVRSSGQPRGWPDDGYTIRRLEAGQALERLCMDLRQLEASSPPYTDWSGVMLDWVEIPGIGGSLRDRIGRAGGFGLYLSGQDMGVEIEVEPDPEAEKTGVVAATAFDRAGGVLSHTRTAIDAPATIAIEGPGVVRVEVGLERAFPAHVCTLVDAMAGAEPKAWGEPIGWVGPTTDPAALSALMPPEPHGGELEDLAARIAAAVADPDALLEVAGEPADGAPSSSTPVVDLLTLASLQPETARALGLLFWDDTAAPGTAYVYAVSAHWRGVEYLWSSPAVTPVAPAEFELPGDFDLRATPLPPVVEMEATGPTGRPATAVGLSWRVGRGRLGPARAADTAVRYMLRRLQRPFTDDPEELRRRVLDDAETEPVGDGFLAATSGLADAPPYQTRDTGLDEGLAAWSLRGLDLFGRPSHPVSAGPIEVWDRSLPPAPAAVRAAFLDRAALPADPGAPAADPLVTAEHAAWMRSRPEAASAIYVGFDWPARFASAAPAVREFRVYCQPSAAVQRLTGDVAAVRAVAGRPDLSEVELTVPLGPDRDAFVGGSLTDGKAGFPIVAVAPRHDARPWVQVANVRAPRRGLPGPDLDPPRYATPTAGVEASLLADLRPVGRWPRVAIVAHARPLRTTLAEVLDERRSAGERLVRVRLAADLAHPDAAGGVFHEGGELVLSTGTFLVARLETVGPDRALARGGSVLVLRLAGDDTSGFVAGMHATYHPGYGVYLPHPFLRGPGEPVAHGLVTVTAANASGAPDAVDDARHAGDARWRESGSPRRGFESATAAPAVVVDVRRAPPPAPPAPSGPDLAGWPDLSGEATVTLRWAPEPGSRYLVHRALDETVYAADRELRRLPNYAAEDPGLAAGTDPAAHPDPAHPGAPDYAALTDAGLLRRIASLGGNASAFTALHERPLGPADLAGRGTAPPAGGPGMWWDGARGELVFEDRVRGIGTNHYFYRLERVDEAGNRSPLGPATAPVARRVRRLPQTPALEDLRSGDRAITLLWRHPQDASVDRYLIYDAASAGELDSLDLLRPREVAAAGVLLVGTSSAPADSFLVVAPDDPLAAGLRWGCVLSRLPPGPRAIAVVAEKEIPGGATLRSAPAVVEAVARELGTPPRPTTTRADRVGGQVRLEWTLAERWYQALVEVRAEDSLAWTVVAEWVTASHTGVDVAADPARALEYRLRARNAAGIVSELAVGTVDPAPA